MLITNYLFKNLFRTAMFITAVVTLVLLLTQSLKLLEMVASSSAPAGIFFKMFALTLPKLFEVILPVSLAITTLFIYNKMIMDNEIVVMRACGFNQFQLAKPVLFIGFASSVILMIFSLWLTPISINEVKAMRFDLGTKYSSFLIREGIFNTFGDGLTVYVREKRNNGEMLGIMIHDSRDKDKPPVTITAKKGQMLTDIGEYPMIVVYNGMRQQIDENTKTLTKLYFSKYSVEVKGLKGTTVQRWRKEDERSFAELLHPNMNDERDVQYKNLFVVEAHRRIVSPWTAFAYTVLSVAFVLFGSFNRRGHSRKILLASVSIIIIQALSIVLINLAKSNLWLIPLMYLNVILPILLGFFMLTSFGERLIFSFKFSKKYIEPKNNVVEVKY